MNNTSNIVTFNQLTKSLIISNSNTIITKGDAVVFLKQYKSSKRKANYLRDKLKALEDDLVLPKGMSISELGHVDGGKAPSPGEAYAIYLDLQADYLRELSKVESICKEIIETIELLEEDIYVYLLREYYCSNKNLKLKDLARELNYTYDWTRQLFSKAIRSLQRLLQKNTTTHTNTH